MWSDESLFELFHSSNTQNDRIWAHCTQDVLPRDNKESTQIMVWDMMSYRGLSDLHFIPPKQTVNALYYVSDILEGTCLNTLKRRRINGPVYSRKLVLKRSEAHFMQDVLLLTGP